MNQELIQLVNDTSQNQRILNKLFGIRLLDGRIQGKIVDGANPVYWRDISELCVLHQNIIKNWIALGGEIEGED